MKWLHAEFGWRILGKRFTLKFAPAVEETLASMDPENREKIMKELDKIARNPYSGDKLYNDNENEDDDE